MRVDFIDRPGPEWERFVDKHPRSTLGHAPEWWEILTRSYGLKPCYLEAHRESGALAGILPLVALPSWRGPGELVSLPYLDSAGPLVAEGEDATQALLDRAVAWMGAQGFAGIEVRSLAAASAQEASDVDRVDLFLPLAKDVDSQWKAVRAKVRNQTRKAEKEGLVLLEGKSSDLLRAFYQPFLVNMRDLGSPVHSRRFFEEIARAFGDRMRIIVTALDNRPVGGLIAIHHGRTVSIPWASTLRSERRRCPNNQIYWEALRWAVERGAEEVDFGRSPRQGGTHRFKVGWGAQPRELDWRKLGADGQKLPLTTLGESPVLRRLSRVWTQLPVPITQWIGPILRKRISN